MSPRQEEEFELILGNKQLLSLFFLVVVLFGVFFSFGYTVGYGRGENSRTRDVAGAEPVEEPTKKVQLPDSLLQEAPKPAETTAAAAKPELPTPITPPVTTTTPAKTTPTPAPPPPAPVQETPKPRPVPVKETPKPAETPAPKPTTPVKSSPPPATSASGSYQLQISAVRVKKDAEVFVEQLKGKGHPALLSDQGDGWYRVVVGPFKSNDEAASYQQRLRSEGFQSLIRKR